MALILSRERSERVEGRRAFAPSGPCSDPAPSGFVAETETEAEAADADCRAGWGRAAGVIAGRRTVRTLIVARRRTVHRLVTRRRPAGGRIAGWRAWLSLLCLRTRRRTGNAHEIPPGARNMILVRLFELPGSCADTYWMPAIGSGCNRGSSCSVDPPRSGRPYEIFSKAGNMILVGLFELPGSCADTYWMPAVWARIDPLSCRGINPTGIGCDLCGCEAAR